MFTPSASCIFPLVALKTAVTSVEVLMWFFHRASISLSVMQKRDENKELRAAESNSGPMKHACICTSCRDFMSRVELTV